MAFITGFVSRSGLTKARNSTRVNLQLLDALKNQHPLYISHNLLLKTGFCPDSVASLDYQASNPHRYNCLAWFFLWLDAISATNLFLLPFATRKGYAGSVATQKPSRSGCLPTIPTLIQLYCNRSTFDSYQVHLGGLSVHLYYKASLLCIRFRKVEKIILQRNIERKYTQVVFLAKFELSEYEIFVKLGIYCNDDSIWSSTPCTFRTGLDF